MNIILGKIGQKIIFNRESSECDRSNTNGNVGTYLLFKLLIDNNKDVNFFVASENDLASFETKPFENVYDISGFDCSFVEKLNIDAMFILTGLTRFEKKDRLFDIINNLSAKFILLSDDPRCLDSVSYEERITRNPDIILSQFEGKYIFKGVKYQVKYVPIERASCYECKIRIDEKDTDMVIISNTSGKEYDRVKIVSEIIDGMTGINIYGRLSEEERMMLGYKNCKGEVKYIEMQNILRKAFSTFIVPIKKGWVTSKYVEALMNGVLPIFHEDYNTGLLEVKNLIVIRNKEEFANVFENLVKNDKTNVKELVTFWRNIMIAPYVDGVCLSNILMSYVDEGGKQNGNC